MLQAAAQRGVRVNIIVYKEVTQALTLSSSHTKHALENLHPNIAVFRHPDHLPDRQGLASDITTSLQHMSLDSASLTKMSKATLKGLYGMNDDVILYWAHHEKLCLIDGQIAFMGGLDLCFGRWDTHQHAIADVHPEDINETVFPGQDYNNSRVLDFHDVSHWEQNQLDRKTMSRMGWSDISISLHGAVVEDLRRHFVERWNFIYDSKYKVRNESRYARLALYGRPASFGGEHGNQQQPNPYPSGNASPQQQQAPASQYQWQQQGGGPTYPPASQASATPQQQQTPNSQYQSQLQGGIPTYPPPPGQASASSQQQSQSYQHGSVPSYASPPGQTSTSPPYQPYQSSDGQVYQPSPSQTYGGPQPGLHYQHQPQQQSAPSYQPYQVGGGQTYTPPASQSPAGQSPQHHQYTYTGNSFPPPPAGPPPSQSPASASYPPQQSGQTPYYAPPPTQPSESPAHQNQSQGQAPYYPPPPGQEASHSSTRGLGDDQYEGERGFAPRRFREEFSQYGNQLRGQLAGQIHQYQDRLTTYGRPTSQGRGNMSCQIVRSCAKWSNGSPLEHSIADAYAAVIRNSQHFVYIENQFFITSTGESQHPVRNKIGAAIVERILRAARAGQKYKIVVVIPSVPCFAGDLRDDETLGTRAIMEFQYNSINRGGNSIMELIAKEGFNPMDYIRFYNLRNYDRINNAGLMATIEQQSGVNYEDARKQYDYNTVGSGGYSQSTSRSAFDTSAPFQQYQQAAQHVQGGQPAGKSAGRWDSVSSCYMLGGEDIRNVPWDGHPDAEIDAFVSEELYVHSKVCSTN
jgi:phospholipase D1/2